MNADFQNPPGPADPTVSRSNRLQDKMPVRVLVVDDSHASADALSAWLRAGGMSVRTVYHGSDALKEAKEWIPDCIVLDVAMPGLSGIGVAAALRRVEATANIALLAFTAFDIDDRIAEMKAAGFNAVCRKPAELTLLEGTIYQLVDRQAGDGFRVVPCGPELTINRTMADAAGRVDSIEDR
jgi:two-component system, OmpR family, response regulator